METFRIDGETILFRTHALGRFHGGERSVPVSPKPGIELGEGGSMVQAGDHRMVDVVVAHPGGCHDPRDPEIRSRVDGIKALGHDANDSKELPVEAET